MIVDADTKPERQIYHLGAMILSILRKSPQRRMKVFETYEHLNQTETVSTSTFFIALDWLFLIGAIQDISEEIVLCS